MVVRSAYGVVLFKLGYSLVMLFLIVTRETVVQVLFEGILIELRGMFYSGESGVASRRGADDRRSAVVVGSKR